MGWNSWDPTASPSTKINSRPMPPSSPRSSNIGWKYAVIDEGWYMANPAGHTLEQRNYLWDAQRPARFPFPPVSLPPPTAPDSSRSPIGSTRRASNSAFTSCAAFPARSSPPICPSPAPHSTPPTPPTPRLPAPGTKATGASKIMPPARPTTTRCFASTHPGASTSSKSTASPTIPIAPLRFARSPKPSANPADPSCCRSRPAPPRSTTPPKSAKYAQMWRIADDHWDGWTFPRKPDTRIPLRRPRHVRSPRAVVRLHQPRQLA